MPTILPHRHSQQPVLNLHSQITTGKPIAQLGETIVLTLPPSAIQCGPQSHLLAACSHPHCCQNHHKQYSLLQTGSHFSMMTTIQHRLSQSLPQQLLHPFQLIRHSTCRIQCQLHRRKTLEKLTCANTVARLFNYWCKVKISSYQRALHWQMLNLRH